MSTIHRELTCGEFREQLRHLSNEDVLELRNKYARTRKRYVRDALMYPGYVKRTTAFLTTEDELEHRKERGIFIPKPGTVTYRRNITGGGHY